MKTKKCFKCGQDKPVTEFHGDRSRKDRLNPLCKQCVYEYQQSRREHIRELARARYRANREAEQERTQENYDLNQSVTAKHAVRHRKPWTQAEDDFIRSDHGLTAYQLAARLGRTYSAIHSRLYNHKPDKDEQ